MSQRADLVAVRGGGLTHSQAITEALYFRFLGYIDGKPKTIQTYTRALKQFFSFLSHNGINTPTREDVIAFREWLTANYRATTVQSYLIAVRLFFKWTEQEGLYKNVADRVKGVKVSRDHKKDYLTSKQVKAVLDSIDCSTLKGARDYAIMALMFTGGLRTIEVARANAGDMRTAGDDTVLYVQGKGRDDRAEYIKVRPKTEQAIRGYLKMVGAPLGPNMPLFFGLSNFSRGERLTTRSVSGIVKERLRAAGYNSDRLTAHSLRHTAVTLALLGGRTIQEVQQFARHANIATTLVYAHNLDRAKNKCEDTIERAIF